MREYVLKIGPVSGLREGVFPENLWKKFEEVRKLRRQSILDVWEQAVQLYIDAPAKIAPISTKGWNRTSVNRRPSDEQK